MHIIDVLKREGFDPGSISDDMLERLETMTSMQFSDYVDYLNIEVNIFEIVKFTMRDI